MPRRAAARALVALALAAAPAVSADGMIKNAEAYWVIDPTDQTCLTELGTFGACDDDALYMYLSRPVGFLDRLLRGTKSRRSLAMVLEPVPRRACLSTKKAHGRTVLGGGDCSSVSRAQQWEMLQSNAKRAQSRTQNEDMVAAVALTTNKQRDCVVRDSSIWSKAARMQRALSGGSSRETAPKGALANTVSVLKCAQRGHTPLELTASNVATSGFLFQAADGAACYDGIRFRACSDEDRSLRWGIGVKFERGRPKTALYKFYNASDSCLVEKGDALVLGSCSQKNALGWGVTRGRLCRNGDCVKSGKCLARSAFDAAAKLFPCKQNVYEHLTLTLDSDGSDALAQALKEAAAREQEQAAKAAGGGRSSFQPSASLPHKPSFWPRRHHPVEPSLFGGQAAGTPCSPQFEFPRAAGAAAGGAGVGPERKGECECAAGDRGGVRGALVKRRPSRAHNRQPPMASPPKQRRFFQRPVNANAPQDYTPFAAPPPPPGSARRSSGRRVTDFLPNATPTTTDSAFSPRRALDFLPTSAPPPRPPPSPLEAENAELRRRLAEAERSAVQDERLLRQRASEDAEALQNEVKELRRRCSLENEERQRAADEAERLSKELTERGEATLQEVSKLNTKLAQAERKVKVRTENEDDDPLRPGFHRRASERIKEVYLSAMNEHFERVASGVVALRKSSEREAAEESVEGYASLVRKALRERSAADANLKDGLEALSPSPSLSPRFDDFASPSSAARVSKPTLTNVSTDPREVEVEITVTTPDATVEYCVSHVNAAGSPRSITIPAENKWTRAEEPGAVRLPRLAAGGRHVVICRATAPGRPTSKVASEAFDLLPPNLVQHSRHPHELRVLRQPGGQCELCGRSDDSRPGYGCPECPAFVLCAKCALPPGFSPDVEQAEKDCVAVDVGAKRVWLSRRIEFKGNYTRILDGSFGVLDQLALTLKKHSGIRLRLEGHVNSKCGLDCDGSSECTNNRCAALFRGRGGSVGFSLGRADAVAEALHERGIEAYRLECRGLGGSRVVEDTEGDLKHRNRRVEVHTVAWS